MFLYELALELEEKSVDLAARAQHMGIPGALPNTELTNAQAMALRGQGPMPGVDGPAASGGPAPLAWGASSPPPAPAAAPMSASMGGEPDEPPAKRRLGRAVTTQIAVDMENLRPKRRIGPGFVSLVVLVAAAVGALGLVAYMTVNMGSLEDKKAELAASTARAEAETKADAAKSAANLLTPTTAAGGTPGATPGSAPAAPATTEPPKTGGASPALQKRGITDEASFCSAAEVAAPWMANVVSKAVADQAGPGGSTLAQWLRDRPLPIDGAFGDLDAATSGALHEDVVALGGAFVFMRDGIVGPNADDVSTAALDSMKRLQSPGVTAAAQRLSAEATASCA